MTNYERIKAMSVEEFAEAIQQMCDGLVYGGCVFCPIKKCADCEGRDEWREWLESEVQDEAVSEAQRETGARPC